ncbi:hypothetical protein HNQ91_003098 [Filimonas zeae]|uniref:Uncharacterized protein n=1 Tax=Filimonas zeae TaxID=1737353 RepID=A0A917IZ69_9BACT|nr:hypothetical protein [Filimonas zeae]MDR6340033.1 hypothetical protein [Filimonas zeae]GGH70829.1 hypothetical protein GCM10011379_29500 [Filimonas zeae]
MNVLIYAFLICSMIDLFTYQFTDVDIMFGGLAFLVWAFIAVETTIAIIWIRNKELIDSRPFLAVLLTAPGWLYVFIHFCGLFMAFISLLSKIG